jgi:hypothetical protein
MASTYIVRSVDRDIEQCTINYFLCKKVKKHECTFLYACIGLFLEICADRLNNASQRYILFVLLGTYINTTLMVKGMIKFKRLSCITWVGSKYYPRYAYKRRAGVDYTQKRKGQCEHCGREWSHAAVSQRIQAAARSCKRQGTDSPFEPLEQAWPCQPLAFCTVILSSDFWPLEIWVNTFLL